MKVGIITFHNVVNYGAVLQCFALQKKLKENGYDVDVIDYENEKFKRVYFPVYIPYFSLRKILYLLYALPQRIMRRIRFNKFYHKYLPLSECVYNPNSINEANGKYDVFVTGSDQVWNLELTDNDKNYFLEFVRQGKKASYAASVGLANLDEEMKKTFTSAISSFDYVSVREETAKQMIDEIVDKDIFVNVDPVLLLKKHDLDEIHTKFDNKRSNYIVVYKINKSETYKVAEELAKKTGLEVRVIQPDRTCSWRFKKYKFASPADFVSLFRNAKYVVTDSFHGTVFSILFEKKFIYCPDRRKDNKNSRIVDLLKLLKLEERCFDNMKNIDSIDSNIDYKLVDNLLNEKRNESIQYLRSFTK